MHNVRMEYVYSELQQAEISANDIANVALKQEKVLGARCFEWHSTYVLALITSPFYLKSERDKFLCDLTEYLNDNSQKSIIVTLDTDIYSRIKEDMSDNEKQTLYQKVVWRQKK